MIGDFLFGFFTLLTLRLLIMSGLCADEPSNSNPFPGRHR